MMAQSRLCVAMNLTNRALTQFSGFNFQSFASFGALLLAANEDGLYQLGAGTDDGTDIEAFATLTLTNFGNYQIKRFIRAHFGLEADGEMLFSLGNDETIPRPFTLPAPPTAGAGLEHGFWVNLDGSQRGTYWQAEISNILGSDFALDHLVLIGAGKQKYNLFSGSTGLSTKLDPVRLAYNQEAGIQDLARCRNVQIDDTGRIRRRKGFARLWEGKFHSLFCAGGHCLVMQDHTSSSALYRVESDSALTGIRSGMVRGRKVTYHSVNGQIYYSNGIENGIYSEETGLSSPWMKGDYVGITTDRETYDPPQANHISNLGGYMVLAEALSPSLLWVSDPMDYRAFNYDDGHRTMGDPVTLLKAVSDGVWVGTTRKTVFLAGVVPEEWQVARTLPYGVKYGSGSHEPIPASRLAIEGIQGEGYFWLSDRGPCWGGPGGQILEFGQDKIDWRDLPGNTAACLVAEDKVVFTVEP